jgi:restriction system protein
VVVPVFNQQSGVEERIIIQCKHYGKKVDNGAVQEIHSAKALYQGQLAVVITNNYFTKPAQELAAANGVRLIDREGLAQLIQKATQKYYAQNQARKENPPPKLVA